MWNFLYVLTYVFNKVSDLVPKLMVCFKIFLHKLFSIYFNIVWFHDFLLYFFRGFVHLGAGLAVGLSGLAAGYAIGIVGDAGVRGTAQQPRLFVGMILILIFAEVCAISRIMFFIYISILCDFTNFFLIFSGFGSLRPYRGYLPVHECELDSGYTTKTERRKKLREIISKFAHFLWFWNYYYFFLWVLIR